MDPRPRIIRRIRRSPPECEGTICPPLHYVLRAARFAVGPLAGQMSEADLRQPRFARPKSQGGNFTTPDFRRGSFSTLGGGASRIDQ